eukprot:760644-Hanusia_phi.AAC.2
MPETAFRPTTRVIVRGRARSGRPAATKRVDLTLTTLDTFFDYRQQDAARLLGISLTSLKSACRQLGLKRWPYSRFKIDETDSLLDRAKFSSPMPANQSNTTDQDYISAVEIAEHAALTPASHQAMHSYHTVAQSPTTDVAHPAPAQPMQDSYPTYTPVDQEQACLRHEQSAEELRILGDFDDDYRDLLQDTDWLDYLVL